MRSSFQETTLFPYREKRIEATDVSPVLHQSDNPICHSQPFTTIRVPRTREISYSRTRPALIVRVAARAKYQRMKRRRAPSLLAANNTLRAPYPHSSARKCEACRIAIDKAVTNAPLHVVNPPKGFPTPRDAAGNPVCPDCGTVWRPRATWWPDAKRPSVWMKRR
jgi:hypothetical protein